MIYLDNAATTMHKPREVVDAVCAAMTSFGGPGRGSHKAALDASMAVFGARQAVSDLLDAWGPASISFALNATMALNIAIDGLLADGARALTTAASHNSVLRPLFRARDERGCEVYVAPVAPDGALDWEAYGRGLEGVSLVVATHASNVTGDVYDIQRMARAAHDAGALFILDAAQTAGAMPLSVRECGADVVCFTGHKSLYGPQGTGGLAVRPGLEVAPLVEGGSGVHSFDERHPRFMPEALEAGTANAHGLAGLAAGCGWLCARGLPEVQSYIGGLVDPFLAGVREIDGAKVLGGGSGARCGIVALNLGDVDSGLVADELSQRFGICVRPGAHCAPLMHRALGTEHQGVVRFSFGLMNEPADVDAALDAIRELAAELG